jgi:hypothetical protein
MKIAKLKMITSISDNGRLGYRMAMERWATRRIRTYVMKTTVFGRTVK